jgi:CubicO group peptidase (beta-lactamase class C family)
MKWLRGLLLLCLPAWVAAAPDPVVDAKVREISRNWLETNGGVGLSIGVYDKGTRQFFNFGTTRIDGGTAPTKDTIYEAGPLAKTMAAQILARAVVEGRAALNDDIARYLPAPYPRLVHEGEPIRLVHLANMTSQLLDNIPDLTQVRPVPGEALAATYMKVVGKYNQQEFLRQLQRVVPAREPGFAPGQSNVASMLLGVALEKIYGESFETLLAREIEKPLRMGSGVNPDAKRLARGYSAANEELPSFDARMAHTWGSLRYSTDDLLRYASWQVVERDASVKLAHQPTWTTRDGKQSVAMYWIVAESPLGRQLSFAGGTWGFASCVELYPDAQFALVLLSNKDASSGQEGLRTLSARIIEVLRPRIAVPAPAQSTDAAH